MLQRAYKLPDELHGVVQMLGKINFFLMENTVMCPRVVQTFLSTLSWALLKEAFTIFDKRVPY